MFDPTWEEGCPFCSYQADYRSPQELIDIGQGYFASPGEKGGVSVFVRDGGTVLHTYSAYGAGTDLLCGTDLYLDLTPLGRQDVDLRHHDKYLDYLDGQS